MIGKLNTDIDKDVRYVPSNWDDDVEINIQNSMGKAYMHGSRLGDGIYLLYNDLHLPTISMSSPEDKNTICINYCMNGRMEWECEKNTYHFLGQGDLQITSRKIKNKKMKLPLSRYQGISILYDTQSASPLLNEFFGDGKQILEEYIKKIENLGGNIILRSDERIGRIFADVKDIPPSLRNNYFKLKSMELLLYLISLDYSKKWLPRIYYHESHVYKVKQLHDMIIKNPEKHFTLEELSKQFNISLTTMKNCFKAIYGMSIYEYLKIYRMHLAGRMLCDKDRSITEVAMSVGYLNASKFTAAFKSCMGMTPREYRTIHGCVCLPQEENLYL